MLHICNCGEHTRPFPLAYVVAFAHCGCIESRRKHGGSALRPFSLATRAPFPLTREKEKGVRRVIRTFLSQKVKRNKRALPGETRSLVPHPTSNLPDKDTCRNPRVTSLSITRVEASLFILLITEWTSLYKCYLLLAAINIVRIDTAGCRIRPNPT